MLEHNSYSDQDLFCKIAENDERAFRVLFDRYKTRFYATALKMTQSASLSEEIVQDVFVSLWNSRAALSEVINPQGYILTVLYRHVYAQFKRTAAERSLKDQLKHLAGEVEHSAEELYYEKETRQYIGSLIKQLPSRQQQIYILSKQEGLSRNEIARKLQLSPNTVKNHLLEAVRFVRANVYRALMIMCFFTF